MAPKTMAMKRAAKAVNAAKTASVAKGSGAKGDDTGSVKPTGHRPPPALRLRVYTLALSMCIR